MMDWVNEMIDECKCPGHSKAQQKLLDEIGNAALDSISDDDSEKGGEQ